MEKVSTSVSHGFSLGDRLLRLSNSPLLLVLLLGATGTVAASWYRTDAAQRAPTVAGYDWSQHSNALLIVLPLKDCGCGASPVEQVREGLEKGLDVVVVANASSPNIKALRNAKFPEPRRFTCAINFTANQRPSGKHT